MSEQYTAIAQVLLEDVVVELFPESWESKRVFTVLFANSKYLWNLSILRSHDWAIPGPFLDRHPVHPIGEDKCPGKILYDWLCQGILSQSSLFCDRKQRIMNG